MAAEFPRVAYELKQYRSMFGRFASNTISGLGECLEWLFSQFRVCVC